MHSHRHATRAGRKRTESAGACRVGGGSPLFQRSIDPASAEGHKRYTACACTAAVCPKPASCPEGVIGFNDIKFVVTVPAIWYTLLRAGRVHRARPTLTAAGTRRACDTANIAGRRAP